jgi:hypothetical protein
VVTRGLILTNGIAAIFAAFGLTLLARPAAARRLLRLRDSEGTAYGLRIAGAMIFAAALFAAGFATMFWVASGGGA